MTAASFIYIYIYTICIFNSTACDCMANWFLFDDEQSLVGMFPVRGGFECAKTIVHGVRRGDRNITDPSWFRILYICKVFVSEVVEWFFSVLFVPQPGVTENSTLTKRILDFTGMKKYIYPASIDSSADVKKK